MSENNLDPRLALTYKTRGDAAISARFGITHRYLTSPEYFWWYLNNATGYFNADFNSEEANQYELCYVQTIKEVVELTLRGYYYDIDDYISSVSVPGIGSVFYNIEQVEIKGLEVGVAANLPYGLRVWTNATWQDGDRSDDPWDAQDRLGNQLPDFPDTMANAGIDYRLDRFMARLWINYVDDREHFDGNEAVSPDAYTLVNVSAAYRLLDTDLTKLDIEITGENLTDEDYEEEEGYPMPGAMVFGGIRLLF
jgi:outer membrane receptor protein involved in Fe transport